MDNRPARIPEWLKKDFEGEPEGFLELLRLAMGTMHISYDDFCSLTPGEFEETCKAWNKKRENEERQEWESLRTLAVMVMQPHCKKKLIQENIMPFPWDGRFRRKEYQMSREEQKKRFDRLLAPQDSPSQSQQ